MPFTALPSSVQPFTRKPESGVAVKTIVLPCSTLSPELISAPPTVALSVPFGVVLSTLNVMACLGGGVGGVPPPESLPLEQPVKISAATKSKTPAAAIGTFFKRVLPSSPPPIQTYRGRFYFVHHKPPLRRDKPPFIIITYSADFHNFY